MRKTYFFGLIFSAFFVLTACSQIQQTDYKNKKADNKNSNISVNSQPSSGVVAVIDSNIIVTSPVSNAPVSSPMKIEGRARVFEGTVLYRLKDASEKLMASGFTTALDGAGWGTYKAELVYPSPFTPDGWLEVYTESAQDGSEQDLIRMPVVFEDFSPREVTIYFSNSTPDPTMLDCTIVYPVKRFIAGDDQVVMTSLASLLSGPTKSEIDSGFFSSIPDGVKINSLEVNEGVVEVDFDDTLQRGVGGSCAVSAIRAQITETLKQFSDTDQVVISVNGDTEEVLQP